MNDLISKNRFFNFFAGVLIIHFAFYYVIDKNAVMGGFNVHDQIFQIYTVLLRDGFETGQVSRAEKVMFISLSKTFCGIPDENLHSFFVFRDVVVVSEKLSMFNPPINDSLTTFRWVS